MGTPDATSTGRMAIPEWAVNVVMKLPPSVQQVLFNPRALCVTTIPASLVLAYLPHFAKYMLLYKDNMGAWTEDNMDPRTRGQARAAALSPATRAAVSRLNAAHMNSLEVFPQFASAVLAATALKAKPLKVLRPAVLFLALRTIYILAYGFGVNALIAAVRTTC